MTTADPFPAAPIPATPPANRFSGWSRDQPNISLKRESARAARPRMVRSAGAVVPDPHVRTTFAGPAGEKRSAGVTLSSAARENRSDAENAASTLSAQVPGPGSSTGIRAISP